MNNRPSTYQDLLVKERERLSPGVVKYTHGPLVEYLGLSPSAVTKTPQAGFRFGQRVQGQLIFFMSPRELEDCAEFLKAAANELRDMHTGQREFFDTRPETE